MFLSGFIFSCFLVNTTKSCVIIHLAVLLVNHLLIHKPIKQFITHWIICEHSGTGPSIEFSFPGYPNSIETIHIFPGALISLLEHTSGFIDWTSLIAHYDSYGFPLQETDRQLLLLALVFYGMKYKSGSNFADVWGCLQLC